MALSVLWTGLVTFSWIFGLITGRTEAVAAAALDGAAEAVRLCLSMLGALMLWNGVMELLRVAGLAAGLARLLLLRALHQSWQRLV